MVLAGHRLLDFRRAGVLCLLFGVILTVLVSSRGGPQRFFQELDPGTASIGVCFDGRETRLLCDFTRVYYPQGVLLRAGAGAVRGFYYSPFFAIDMRLLSLLPFAYARTLWFAIILLSVAVIICLPALFQIATTLRGAFAYVLVLATSLPLLHDLFYGQVSSILLSLIALSFLAYQRERRVLSAVLLGLATAIKFYPALFAVYFLARRDLRTTLHFGVTVALCLGLLPWLFLGSHGYFTLASGIALNLRQLQSYLESSAYSNAAVTVFTTTAQLWLGMGEGARAMAIALSACVALLLFALMLRSAWRDDALSSLLLGCVLLPFVVRSCWVHYFVFLPLLQARVLVAGRAAGASAGLRWCGLVGSLSSATLVSYPYFRLAIDADSYYRVGFPFWATLALVPAICLSQLDSAQGKPPSAASAPG